MNGRNFPQAIWWRGRMWPVSPEFHAQTTILFPELEDMEWEDIMVEIRRLLELSEAQSFHGLDPEDRLRLEAYTKHWNLRSNIDFLQGRPCSDFGFTHYDQCHGWRGTFECGCVLHGVFDHYLALAIGAKEGELSPEILERHPDFKVHPHYPRHVCAQHRPHAHDLHALLSAVLADSQVELAD